MINSPDIVLRRPTSHPEQVKGHIKEVKGLDDRITNRAAEQIARKLTARDLWLEHETKRVKKYEKISIIDPLTGMYDRGFLDGDPDVIPPKKGILEREIERILKEKNNNLTVAMLDIDRFKGINDKFGHPIGDEVLKKVAQIVLEHIRFDMGDFAIRYGGEEFLIITPNELDMAKKMIERIRTEIEKIQFNNDKYPKSITISCGMTNLTKEGINSNLKEISEALIKRADDALYKSKIEGRNKTTIALRRENGEIIYEKITIEK